MARWLITQDEVQFGVEDLGELKELARKGKLSAADMVQPPGATDWLYASEIPELEGMLGDDAPDDDDLDWKPRRGILGAAATGVIALILVGITLVGGGAMYVFYRQMPAPGQSITDQLAFSEMVVTQAGAPLRAEADAGASTASALEKDSIVDLLAKRGEFYRVRTKQGQEGWVQVDQVLPMYLLGGGSVREEYDPLYNPDRYVSVTNASWLQLDRKNDRKTVFNFQLENQSRYPMTDVVLLATIKDSKGTELEKVEISVTGEIPPYATSMVGTLEADPQDPESETVSIMNATYEQMAGDDPDLALRFRDGVEVEMTTEDFTEANIDLLEIRAVPVAPEKTEG